MRVSFFLFCSEGNNNGIIAYYLSEFNVRESQVSAVDEAIASMDDSENTRKSRRGFSRMTDSLIIDGITSGGKSNTKQFHITCFGLSSLVIQPGTSQRQQKKKTDNANRNRRMILVSVDSCFLCYSCGCSVS